MSTAPPSLQQKNALSRCLISLPQSLIHSHGTPLLEYFTELFPHTYFEISTNNPIERRDFYCATDMALTVLSEELFRTYQADCIKPYAMRLLTTLPIYIRTTVDSPLAQEKQITLDTMRQYPYCALKNVFNTLGFASILGQSESSAAQIELKKTFCDYIEKFGHFTIDLNLNGSFMFDEEFSTSKSVVLRKTEEQFYVVIFYKDPLCRDYYPLFADFFKAI